MNNYRDIIKAPIITEKASTLKENNVYTFSVDVKAGRYSGYTNKVKKAIVKLKEGSSIELD